jgi:hypothetical protein
MVIQEDSDYSIQRNPSILVIRRFKLSKIANID